MQYGAILRSGQSALLTLAFTGETNRALDVLQAMREAGPEAFELILCPAGAGLKPERRRFLVWANVAENRSACRVCRTAGRTCCGRRGFDIERRPFRPHITLGRQVVLTEERTLI